MNKDLSGLQIPKDAKAEGAPGASGFPLWKVLLTTVLLALAAGGAAYWVSSHRLPEVEVGTVTVQRPDQGLPVLSATGYVVPRLQVVVAAKTAGRIAKIHADDGQHVAAGQMLAELEADELRANLARAQAEFDEAQRQWQRYLNLWKEGIVAKAELDRIETAYKVAKAAFEFGQAQIENTVIRAPFAGTILKKHIEVGQMLTPGAVGDGGIGAFTLADLDHLEVDVDVSESNIQKIGADHPAEIVVEALPDKIFRARVVKIAPSANRQKAVVEVTVRILDRHPALKPEMSAKVTFVEREQAAPSGPARVLVPKAAVQGPAGGTFVWTLRTDGPRTVLKRQTVTCGKEWMQYREVAAGLAGGEQVVVGGAAEFADGQAVKIKAP